MRFIGKKLMDNFVGRTADEGGGGDGGSLTMGDILDAQAANSVDFSQFDFTKYGKLDTDEEPVNFFGKSDNKIFHKTIETMLKKFKKTDGDGVFRVFGHGNFGSIWDGDKEIFDAKD